MEPQRPARLPAVLPEGGRGLDRVCYSSCVEFMRSDSGVHNALLSCGVPNLLTHTLRCTKTHVKNDLLRTRGPLPLALSWDQPAVAAATIAALTLNQTGESVVSVEK